MSGSGDDSGASPRRAATWERHFSPEVGAASGARAFAVDAIGLADSRCDDVALLVSELTSNAVLHARTPFSVRVTVDEGRIRLEVRDGNPAPPTLRRYSADAVTGRGVAIVDDVSDRWGVESQADGKVVWCELDGRPIDLDDLQVRHD